MESQVTNKGTLDNIDEEIDNILGVPAIARRFPEKYGDSKKQVQKKLIKSMVCRTILEARIDEEETYWWHQQKLAEREGVSSHSIDRITILKDQLAALEEEK